MRARMSPPSGGVQKANRIAAPPNVIGIILTTRVIIVIITIGIIPRSKPSTSCSHATRAARASCVGLWRFRCRHRTTGNGSAVNAEKRPLRLATLERNQESPVLVGHTARHLRR